MKDFISERPIKKLYYSHSEIGKMINEPAWMVNFWAKQLKFKRKKGNVWHYDRNTVAKFHLIKHLVRNEGWTIERLRIKFT